MATISIKSVIRVALAGFILLQFMSPLPGAVSERQEDTPTPANIADTALPVKAATCTATPGVSPVPRFAFVNVPPGVGTISLQATPTATATASLAGNAPRNPSEAVTTATPSLGADVLRDEIKAGDEFSAEKRFDKAQEAYLLALKSTDAQTRKQALKALKSSLEEEDSLGRWVITNVKSWTPFACKTATVIIVIAAVWYLAGRIGDRRGQNWIKVAPLQGVEGEGTARFRLALAVAFAEQRQGIGPVTANAVTPYLAESIGTTLAETLPEVDSSLPIKFLSVLLDRLRRPEFLVHVGWSVDDKDALLVVALERRHELKKVWHARPDDKNSFAGACRLAYEVSLQVIRTV